MTHGVIKGLSYTRGLVVKVSFVLGSCLVWQSTRESTPCSLIRDSSVIHTPGSTTRQRTNRVIHENVQRSIPTSSEMDEFFDLAEKKQQAIFMEKYNFDVVNDVPLPGRYEWVPVLD
ncbi:Cyclin-dependent kinase inhibitor family protein [Trifolium repens]|nr:Cyclin-dependent kinase inhibitor family protein [Trifolium repens]